MQIQGQGSGLSELGDESRITAHLKLRWSLAEIEHLRRLNHHFLDFSGERQSWVIEAGHQAFHIGRQTRIEVIDLAKKSIQKDSFGGAGFSNSEKQVTIREKQSVALRENCWKFKMVGWLEGSPFEYFLQKSNGLWFTR